MGAEPGSSVLAGVLGSHCEQDALSRSVQCGVLVGAIVFHIIYSGGSAMVIIWILCCVLCGKSPRAVGVLL